MLKRILLLLLVSPSALALDGILLQPLGVHDAAHLLRRAGIGADPVVVEKIAPLTRQSAIDLIVDGLQTQPATPLPDWVNASAPVYWARGDMPREGIRSFNRARDREISDLRRWWVAEMIATPSPQTERLVLMWHNHFVTAYSLIDEESTSIARQNQMFRSLGSGNFRELLRAVIRDPAMLNYLDNRSNKKRSPNENLAREMLELFTLGEGHFDEFTVKEAARALTGYTVALASDMRFNIEHWYQDDGEKTLFGQTGRFDGDDLVDIILQQDALADHIARLFWKQYISEFTVPDDAIASLAERFRQSDYDIKTLLRSTLQRPEFWATEFRGQIVKSPVDLLIGTIRSTGYVPEQWDVLPVQLARLGQTLFDAPDVAGWNGGADWVSPARLLDRQQLLEEIFLSGLAPALGGGDDAGAQAMLRVSSDSMSGTDSMMATEPSAKLGMSPGMSPGKTESSQLKLRVAAENYQGAPTVRVILIRDEEVIWRSPDRVVPAGRDTEKLGRASDKNLLPWQTLHFELPQSLAPATEVEVHYINDAAGEDGDRNLYVDWVQVAGQYHHAYTGTQASNCPPKNSDDAGYLFCAGRVTIPVQPLTSLPVANAGAGRDKDAVSISRAYTWWFNRPEHRWGQIVFGLTDLRFGQRQWDSLLVRAVDAKAHGRGLHFGWKDCAPDCQIEWPDCAWTHKFDSTRRSIFVPLHLNETNEQLACHWESLQAEDQQLLSSLLQVLPQLVDAVADGRRAAKRPELFEQWSTGIKREIAQLDERYRVPQATSVLQVTLGDIAQSSTPIEFQRPQVGGRPDSLNAEALRGLQVIGEPSDWLLATTPLATTASGDAYWQLLKDPVYQVK